MRSFHILILIAILFTSHLCEARPDTTYFDSKWKKTEFDYADYYRITNLQEDHLYKVSDYYMKNSKLQMSGYYSNIDSGIREGTFVFYDVKGNIDNEGSFKNNKRVGEWKFYYPESKDLWYVEHFEDDELSGELISYYRSGKIKRREIHKINDTTVTGNCFEENGESRPFTPFMILPKRTFDLNKFLAKNLVYPREAQRKNIEGRVIIDFVVQTDGTLDDYKLVKSVYPALDYEALRVIAKMPKWIPAIVDDKVAKTRITQPTLFQLID